MDSAERPVLRPKASRIALGLGMLVLLVMTITGTGGSPVVGVVFLTAVTVSFALLAVWAMSMTRVERRRHEDALTRWAAERAITGERMRIARDLHDLASHGLGLITVRAAAARAPGADDEERRVALADIEGASRQATTELRRLLGILRDPGADAPLRPAESLADLPHIVEDAQRGGVEPDLRVGQLGEVSAGVQVVVCAVVREGLANVARHVGPGNALVSISRVRGSIVVEVGDDGPRPGWEAPAGSGAGLAGLRERVGAVGGQVSLEPDGGGHRLVARIPDRSEST